MEQFELLGLICDSFKDEVVFVNTNHVIRYVNTPAVKKYAKRGNVLGKSIFACHNPESGKMIRAMYERLQNGENDILFADNEKHREYMRAVRDNKSNLIGYYERFEPPVIKANTGKVDFHS